MLERSVTWLDRRLEAFAPPGQPLTLMTIKRLAELAIAHLVLSEQSAKPVAPRFLPNLLGRWQEWLEQTATHPKLLDAQAKFPSYAFPLLLPYLILRAEGHRNHNFEHQLRRALERGLFDWHELVPYRLLDQQYFLWKADCLREEPLWEALYRKTTLAASRQPIRLRTPSFTLRILAHEPSSRTGSSR
jgi:hypothetical protein